MVIHACQPRCRTTKNEKVLAARCKVKRQLRQHQPVISVYTKEKELVGDFQNNGWELGPKGPEQVRVHDFLIPELGRANPYGIYDIAYNTGRVSVGVDHDTTAFAAESIRHWWNSMGQALYPRATRLLITADSGGSSGVRVRPLVAGSRDDRSEARARGFGTVNAG